MVLGDALVVARAINIQTMVLQVSQPLTRYALSQVNTYASTTFTSTIATNMLKPLTDNKPSSISSCNHVSVIATRSTGYVASNAISSSNFGKRDRAFNKRNLGSLGCCCLVCCVSTGTIIKLFCDLLGEEQFISV